MRTWGELSEWLSSLVKGVRQINKLHDKLYKVEKRDSPTKKRPRKDIKVYESRGRYLNQLTSRQQIAESKVPIGKLLYLCKGYDSSGSALEAVWERYGVRLSLEDVIPGYWRWVPDNEYYRAVGERMSLLRPADATPGAFFAHLIGVNARHYKTRRWEH